MPFQFLLFFAFLALISIFFSRGFPAANVALRLVLLQHKPHLFRQKLVELRQPFYHILVERAKELERSPCQ